MSLPESSRQAGAPAIDDLAIILPAAGSGTRMGGDVPKPFLQLAGRLIIEHTLDRLRAAAPGAEVILVLPTDRAAALEAEHGPVLRAAGVRTFVAGGASRQASVALGMKAICRPARLVAVHDAVRPFASPSLITAVADAARSTGGALPVLPITDTLKRVEDGVIAETIPRAGLHGVQTPQIFDRALLRRAYAEAEHLGEAITDDASLVEAVGGKVAAVPGECCNLKVTTPDDLRLAEALLAAGLV